MQKLIKALAAIMLTVAVVVAAGCTKDPENGGGNNNGGNGSGSGNGGGNNGGGNSGGGTSEGVYLGVIGFNDDLKTKTIGLLDASSESAYTNFISGLEMRDGTVLYHADNKALDWLQNATLPSQLFNVSLVTFTDGLDNGSTMLNNSYNDPSDYLNAVSDRIRNERVGGKAITAYSIGLRGNDVTDNTSFQQNLQMLSSSPSNYFEVSNWEEAKQRFRQIAIQLYNETTTINAEVKIPGGKADGTVIRITFDNVSNANASSQFIQGTYYRENGKGKLKNVIYHGLQSSSGAEVVSDRQDGIFYWYSFAELKLPNGNPFANTSNMNMWYNLANFDWQPESEFTPESYSDINVNRKSAVAVLVLDCSSSLGSDFINMKEAAIEFVQLLNDYGNSDNGGNGGGNGGGETAYYTVNVSANPNNGGTVSGGGTYQQGQSCTVSATVASGYIFTNWTENGNQVSTNANYTFTVSSNRSLVANFTYNGGGNAIDYSNIVLNELNGDTKFIEIFNKGNVDMPLEGMYIMKDDYAFGPIWTADATIVVPAGGYVLLYSEDVTVDHPEHPETLVFHSGLSAKKTLRITLFMPNGSVRDEFTRGTQWGQNISSVAPQSYARTPNGGDWKLADPTPNAPNPSTGDDIPEDDNAPIGAINGKFTINSSGSKVYFSKGNLQYKASSGTWQFAANQFDYIGDANSNISSSYSGWIDLFGWGTSGWNCGNTYYCPWDSNNSNGSLYGPPGSNNLSGSYVNSDWGRYNAISNGGNTAGQWRTLTGGSNSEWYYVFYTRNTSSGIRFAKAQVAGVNGVILLPDDWSTSTYSLTNTNTSGASFSSNVISASQWATLENAGAVFLPAAGYRNGASVDDVGFYGYYWSASCYGSNIAYGVYFRDSDLYTGNGIKRYYGFTVRLVCACQ